MTSQAQLLSLEKEAQTRLFFAALVSEGGERKYLALAQESFFLIPMMKKKMVVHVDTGNGAEEEEDDTDLPEEFLYEEIKEVNVDRSDTYLLQVVFRDGEHFYIHAQNRREVLDEIMYKTDCVMRGLEATIFPLNRTNFVFKEGAPEAKNLVERPSELPIPEGRKKCVVGDYTLFVPDGFVGDEQGDRGDVAHTFRADDGTYFTVEIFPIQDVSVIVESDEVDLKRRVNNHANRSGRLALQRDQDDFAILASLSKVKRKNLTGDPAQWICWMAHLHAVKTQPDQPEMIGEVGICHARRKYLPTKGDIFQDIRITFFTPFVLRENPKHVLPVLPQLEEIVDSTTSTSNIFFYDEPMIQKRADMFAFDEEAYLWFDIHHDIRPSRSDWVRTIVKAVLEIAGQVGCAVPDANSVFPDDRSPDDIFEVIRDLEGQGTTLLGVSGDGPDDVFINWRRCVARYVAHAIDGGTTPELTMLDVIEAEDAAFRRDMYRERVILRRFINYLLHVSPKDSFYEDSEREDVIDKTMNPDAQERGLFYNSRVMVRLLEGNYFKRTFDEDRPQLLGPFYRLILTNTTDKDVQIGVCEDIAKSVTTDPSSKDRLAEVIPAMVSPLEYDDIDVVRASLRALVNITAECMTAKKKMVESGGIPLALNHFTTRIPEVKFLALSVVSNCSGAQDTQDRLFLAEKVAYDGAIPAVLQVLRPSALSFLHSPDSVTAKAASILWNLGVQDQNRASVLTMGGIEAMCAVLQQPVSVDVLNKMCGALMVLSANNAETKAKIGKCGAVDVLTTLADSSRDSQIIKSATGALAILCSNHDNLEIMRRNGIQKALERVRLINDPQIDRFALQIQSHLDAPLPAAKKGPGKR